MISTYIKGFANNFLGHAPNYYKMTILFFLILNPLLLFVVGPFITGWILILEFIFTLAMALKCYPLPAGGLLAIEAVCIGMASPKSVYDEALHNFPVILLLIFMVAGIYFMKDLLQYIFTKMIVKIRSKTTISVLFCFMGAFLSAFLDALTVTAVIIAVAYGFYNVYHRFESSRKLSSHQDDLMETQHPTNLENFRGYLRNIVMHGAVGTALGGVCTLVGEPQNLLIGHEMGWHFAEFFIRVAPISMPVLFIGLATTIIVEKMKWFSYGFALPEEVRAVLLEEAELIEKNLQVKDKAKLIIQSITALWLIISLAFHLAEVGIIGLSIIILLTSLNGVSEEHQIGHAFTEALPFTALLVVFFAIVAVIHDLHLFAPVIHFVLSLSGKIQLVAYYLANGILSAISDNVFVATVYISETKKAFLSGTSGLTAEQFNMLAVAINTGTNIPSVATPNGQAAFLFLLTSSLAPLIRLSYGKMVWLALPYTISMTLTGLIATWFYPIVASWIM
ncbi:MAG: sodium/proton antiporter NhaB [Desulfobacterales bacterium]|nr:sodium/proton antiporter NhaB [Desulfobacterales bacterium]